jgi:CubicO group peptidase (beta-lactamase class C family)
MRIFFLIAILLLSKQILAASIAEVSPIRITGGMASEFRNIKLDPKGVPTPLPNKELSAEDRDVIARANQLFDQNPSALEMILVDHGQVLLERYRDPASPNRPAFSMSMSKSLTAYTIGNLVCSGKISDLNAPSAVYAPVLKDTVYGEATVKNLLTMSSGVKDAPHSGDPIQREPCRAGVDCDGWQMQRSQILTGRELIHQFPNRERPSGSRFSYNALDTLALSEIAEQQGGFINNFTQFIWDKAGSESSGYWLVDKDNRAIAQAGFSATIRDWARLALFSIGQLNSSNSCISNFMKDATSSQIANKSRAVGASFSNYGYQTWIADFGPRDSYWWVGYGGQRVGVDPQKEKIIVVISKREDYMSGIYKFFSWWQRQ